MWDKTKQRRFRTLRARQRRGVLTAEEQTELDGLFRDLEDMEASYLHPATARKQQEAEKLRAINVALRDVIRRREEHLARTKATLAQLHAEHEALEVELEQILVQAAQVEAEVTG